MLFNETAKLPRQAVAAVYTCSCGGSLVVTTAEKNNMVSGMFISGTVYCFDVVSLYASWRVQPPLCTISSFVAASAALGRGGLSLQYTFAVGWNTPSWIHVLNGVA